MKKLSLRVLCALFTVALLLCTVPAVTVSAETTYAVYVSAEGADTNAGTVDAPVQTFAAALTKCKDHADATVYVVGEVAVTGSETLPSGVTNLTVTGSGAGAALNFTSHFLMYKSGIQNLVFSNLTFIATGTKYVAFAPTSVSYCGINFSGTFKLYAIHHSTTAFTNGNIKFEVGPSTGTSINEVSVSGGGNNSGTVTFNVNGGNVSWLHTGNANGSGVYTGNITVNLNSGSIGTLNVGGNGAATSVVGNVYVNINGGTARMIKSEKIIDGDVIFTVNDYTQIKGLAGATVAAGHSRVLLMNNGKTLATANAGVAVVPTNIDYQISSPVGVFSRAVLNADGSFAKQIAVSCTDAACDKAVLKDADGKILASTNTKNENGEYIFDVTTAGTYKVDCEDSSKAQVRGYQVGNDKAKIRIVGTVDSMDYNAVGMDISATWGADQTKTWPECKMTKVYYSISGQSETGIEEYTAASLAGTYLFAVDILNIPETVTGPVTVTVVPFTYVDGTKVCGETASFTVTLHAAA